jgi:hypothetical protein
MSEVLLLGGLQGLAIPDWIVVASMCQCITRSGFVPDWHRGELARYRCRPDHDRNDGAKWRAGPQQRPAIGVPDA